MFFSYFFLFVLGALFVEAGNSAEFTLELKAPETSSFDNYNLYLNESLLSVSDVTSTVTGYIHSNGSLILSGQALGVGRGYLTTSPQSSSWKITSPWKISEGLLRLNGNATFYAVPDTSTGRYMLSADEESTNRGITLVNIQPTLSNGKILEKWPKTGLSSGKIAAAVVVPIVGVVLIAVGVFAWFRLRRKAMAPSIHMNQYPNSKFESAV